MAQDSASIASGHLDVGGSGSGDHRRSSSVNFWVDGSLPSGSRGYTQGRHSVDGSWQPLVKLSNVRQRKMILESGSSYGESASGEDEQVVNQPPPEFIDLIGDDEPYSGYSQFHYHGEKKLEPRTLMFAYPSGHSEPGGWDQFVTPPQVYDYSSWSASDVGLTGSSYAAWTDAGGAGKGGSSWPTSWGDQDVGSPQGPWTDAGGAGKGGSSWPTSWGDRDVGSPQGPWLSWESGDGSNAGPSETTGVGWWQ